ncbi:MAG: DUF6384 family protein [Rhodospirillales bacterium]
MPESAPGTADPKAPEQTGEKAAGGKEVPLDEVMLAMDVVDTLRHADTLVERELSGEERDRRLRERLRGLYKSQGIEVPDHILDEGVAALREDRFVYKPPAAGLRRSLALAYVNRGRWLKGLAIVALLGAVLVGGYWFVVERPAQTQVAQRTRDLGEALPQGFAAEQARILAISRSKEATDQATSLVAEGEAAIKAGDAPAAKAKLAQLTQLRQLLEQTYVIRVISRPNQSSGVWRVPKLNPGGRNYYLIVETVDAAGHPVPVTITSEEDNKTAQVSTFGLRVDERTFNRVRADKQDDGIIQNNRVGEKRTGMMEPIYTMPTLGGAILQW